MRAFFVSHTHWDREWYRTFEDFRGRLVDAVDRILDLASADPDYRFLLDGQTIALEDYREIRPDRVPELRQRIAEGRIAIGPWSRRARNRNTRCPMPGTARSTAFALRGERNRVGTRFRTRPARRSLR